VFILIEFFNNIFSRLETFYLNKKVKYQKKEQKNVRKKQEKNEKEKMST
jgi:membrane protein insertase Oxa1/YidC/SpoIIIJ